MHCKVMLLESFCFRSLTWTNKYPPSKNAFCAIWSASRIGLFERQQHATSESPEAVAVQ